MRLKIVWSVLLLIFSSCGREDVTAALNQPLPEKLIKPAGTYRFATFNASLYRNRAGELIEDLRTENDKQVLHIVSIIKSVDPDILVINEFDWDKEGQALSILRNKYLTEQNYKYYYLPKSNTGLNTAFIDFDQNGYVETKIGTVNYAGDSFGYGRFEGQYGMAILSKLPIELEGVRTFQKFKWKDMPGNLIPKEFYRDKAENSLRLSSKNHVDVPVKIQGKVIHVLMSHPTPPAFDGDEDRNGRRNFDEIRLWKDYIDKDASEYIYDDKGARGGLREKSRFVIMGDLNADPNDGDSVVGAIDQLLENSMVNAIAPASRGGWVASAYQAGANDIQTGYHETDTADFRDKGKSAIGNLRLDYVLPSRYGLEVMNSGVFWPTSEDEVYAHVGPGYPVRSSDHRLVWVDLKITK